MDSFKFGELLEKQRRKDAINAAQTIRDYCTSVNECDKECVFFSQITAECIFTRHNKYGFHITPEDWEV